MTAIIYTYVNDDGTYCRHNQYGYTVNSEGIECPHPSSWVRMENSAGSKWMHSSALEWYYEDTTHEFEYDDGTYDSLEDLMSEIYDNCDDFSSETGDKYGDHCDWYNENADVCGEYDIDTFTAARHCCVCGGGQRATCTDGDSSDSTTVTNAAITDE